jgi:hypothetical protein
MIATRSIITILAVLLTTIVSGVIHGRLTNRWGAPVDLTKAGEELQNFPTTLGEWNTVKELPLADPVRQTLQCVGYVSRMYEHQPTGQVVHMVLLVGPPGPTAVHIPDICYSSQDYRQEGPRQAVEIASEGKSESHRFWSLTLYPNTLESHPLQSYYGWSDGGNWDAAENPRLTFGGRKLLYKLQLASAAPVSSGNRKQDSGAQQDSGRLFLQSLLASGTWPLESNN